MKQKLFVSLVAFCLFVSLTNSAFAVEKLPGDSYPSKKEIAKMANELEYIYTNIIVKDETTGEYTINQVELDNSTYTEEEKAGMIVFSSYLNEDDGSISPLASKTFKKCMSEALGIYGSALNQFITYVDKKDWVGAAGVLSFFGISVNPVTVFIFALTCGAGSASSVPVES